VQPTGIKDMQHIFACWYSEASTALGYFGWCDVHLILMVAMHVQCLR